MSPTPLLPQIQPPVNSLCVCVSVSLSMSLFFQKYSASISTNVNIVFLNKCSLVIHSALQLVFVYLTTYFFTYLNLNRDMLASGHYIAQHNYNFVLF